MFKKFVNKKGFSLIEVSMAIGFLSIVGLSAAEIMQSGQKDNLKLNLSRLALQSRQKIESQLKNPVAWNKTTSLNSSFSCFNSASGCSLNSAAGSNGFYPFVVHDADPDLATAKKLSFDPTDLSAESV